MHYTFQVPNGGYTVNLKFAEIYFTSAGQRVFNIQINGQTVQSRFDPFVAAGGANLAVDRSFPITVINGQVDIQLISVISNPKISAIEILGSGSSNPPPAFTPIRVNAGGPAFTDQGTGFQWSADSGFDGGATYATGANVLNTSTPQLYQTERWNSPTVHYNFQVPNRNLQRHSKIRRDLFHFLGAAESSIS